MKILKHVFGVALFVLAMMTSVADAQSFPATSQGSITTQNLVPAGVATAGSAVELIVPANVSAVAIQVTGTYTGALSVQVTADSINWVTLAGASAILNVAAATNAATIASAAVGVYSVNPSAASRVRVTGLAAMTGTAVVTLHSTGF